MNLNIVTPEGSIYNSNDVDCVTVQTVAGVISIYPGHMHIMTLLAPGELLIEKDGHNVEMVISSGMMQIEGGDTIKMMVETAERVEEIDLEAAKEAHRRAEEYLVQQENLEDVEFSRAQAQILKELARIDAASKFRKRGIQNASSN